MDTNVFELKNSFKQLLKNLVIRIDNLCIDLIDGDTQRLKFFLEDLTTLTEVVVILSHNKVVSFDINIYNEKAEMLLDKVEENDFRLVADILRYELKPLLSYWDGCMTDD